MRKLLSNNLLTLFSFLLLFLINPLSLKAEEKSESKTAFIFEHIADSHQWHFATIGHTHIALDLPVILYSPDRGIETFMASNFLNEHHDKVAYNGYALNENDKIVTTDLSRKVYDFSITKNVASMFVGVILLFLVFFSVAAKYKKNPVGVPKGMQSLIEPIILFVRDEIVIPNIGKEKYERFMPYLLSVFFFIFFNNLLGLVPGSANLTGNISVTFSLAIITFIITNFSGNKNYWKHIFATPGVPWWLAPIMIPVELIGLITKPFALMVRLFANITAGHILVLSVLGLIFMFNSLALGPVSVLFATFLNFLELLVAFLQAFIFTLLSSIFIGGAVAEHHHEHEDHEHKIIEGETEKAII